MYPCQRSFLLTKCFTSLQPVRCVYRPFMKSKNQAKIFFVVWFDREVCASCAMV